ncbi:hypothetical protein Nepgr_003989 [Nepenthes gracilis]|uniref:Uncharacterized protein n=1 Tax=Nepenthes gracilis TaxID=150966 RepID=A0AAD3S0J6_NEPGR|nr:hypothetical protein Nepgr_003989 [Nepenthes gracilis]
MQYPLAGIFPELHAAAALFELGSILGLNFYYHLAVLCCRMLSCCVAAKRLFSGAAGSFSWVTTCFLDDLLLLRIAAYGAFVPILSNFFAL